jgi:ribose transport system ATP-binding protein
MAHLLEARDISKRFPGVQALDCVDLTVRAGEVLAVVGENGAGKSTLMKVLGGVHPPDEGAITVGGQPVRILRVHDAEALGIVLIHQELNLAEHLDVAGNVFLGREPTRGGWLRLIDPAIYPAAEAITRRLGLEVSPRRSVGTLPVGQQQLVEIARALSLKSRLLILDEPTSALTERETARLFEVLRDLKGQGLAIVYISHRLKEVEAIADRVVVLRDGKNAGALERHQINHEAIVRLMVGRELKQFFQRQRGIAPVSAKPRASSEATPPTAPVLQVRELRWSAEQAPISFQLWPGEIVGLAGLIGAGRSELAETIFGVRRRVSGELLVGGQARRVERPGQAITAGIFLVPEDRRTQGLILTAAVRPNISLPNADRISAAGLVLPARERELAQTMCGRLQVRTPGIEQTVALLSGGNQQKVVLAKWLCRTPRVLILDEPTRGIDVGAKSEIYGLMDRLAQQGVAILMISSDLEEILGMSDRVLVMHQGRLAGEVRPPQLTEENIMRLATGGT